MMAWLRESPGLVRAAALSVGLAVIAFVAPLFGQPVDWPTAVIYGIALALGMRWPIVMPGTGLRVVLISGLALDALWNHGLFTSFALLMVEFALRMFVLYRGLYFWEWYRPLILMAVTTASYGLTVLASGGTLQGVHYWWPRFDTAGLTLAYSFWALLNLAWSLIKAPLRGKSRTEQYIRTMQQTWWVPPVFLLVAWPLEVVHYLGYPLEGAVALLLVGFQAFVGPVFTTLHQDRSVSEMVRQAPHHYPAQRLRAYRILRVAHQLARALPLPEQEIRLLGYAALLQEPHDEEGQELPLWFQAPPTPEQREVIRRVTQAVRLRVERDGCLEEVAQLLQYRYASWDGSGFPQVAGAAIPVTAQVLTAANAIIHLTAGGKLTIEQAAAQLRDQAASRFSPNLINAIEHVYLTHGSPAEIERDLPETVRQLQGLVTGPERPSSLSVGLRRLWLQLRGQVGLVPDLPPEVQAVARMATFFAASTDSARTAQIAVEAVGQLIGAKVGLALSEGEDLPLNMRFKASHGFQRINPVGRAIAVQGGQMTRTILNQAPLQVADLREMNSTLSHEIAQAEGIRSVLFVPLAGRGRTIGLLFVGMPNYHWFTPQEVGLIHLMAGQAAMALENARLIAEADERLNHISDLKAFTDTLLDTLSSAIIVTDPEGQVVLTNAAARSRFGDQVQVGEGLPRLLCEACQVEKTLAGETTPEVDITWHNAILEVASIPLRDANGVMMGAICLARDVTQVRNMEQQVRRVEKLAAIGELAAGAAHEIRNPLTAIRGFMQLLQARAGAATGADYYQIILSEIDRIDGIIRDLLLLARPADLQRAPTPMAEFLDEVFMLVQGDLDRQGITIVRQLDPSVGPVPLDPKMFRQLLLNLTINASQAMPYGGTLTISLRPEGEEHVALVVSDTGIGIAPENLKRLFIPFFTTKEEGTGLGLALCYSIVQAHNGRIEVESRIGEGTTFAIILPR